MAVITDSIAERTAGAGVTVDGLLIKDGLLPDVTPADIGAEAAGSAATAVSDHEATYDHGNIPNVDAAAALAAYQSALATAAAGEVLTASGPGSAAFAAVAGGPGLSDYSNVTVVDASGAGDYTTLGAAIAASGTSDLIVIFGSLASETITLTTGTYTLWLPSYRTNASIALTISGASVIIAGSGRMTGTINLTSGSLNLSGGVRATTVNVSGGTLYGYQPYISTVNLNALASLRIVGAYISTLMLNADMNTTGSGSYVTQCYLVSIGADQPRTDVPIFNCTFFDPPYNISLASGNYSNVAIGFPSNGSNWPAIP